MGYIKNFDQLSQTLERKVVLELIETALDSIQPEKVLSSSFKASGNQLKIKDYDCNLNDFEQVFLLGFGKGSARISKIMENTLGDFLTEGFVIDVSPEDFSKIQFTQGTHPLPSQGNIDFTNKVIDKLGQLSKDDLVLVIICGGGSAMLTSPLLTIEQIIEVNNSLLGCGLDIYEMNTVRKHLDRAKGGGLSKILYPATVFNLIFSDVPGNDFSVVASGPTVKDKTTVNDALQILKKWGIKDLPTSAFAETPKEDKYFEKVSNILMLSHKTALDAMKQKAKGIGIESFIYFDAVEGEAKIVGGELIKAAKPNSILLAGGETTVRVLNKNGKGGRNQELVLGALGELGEGTVIASFDSDGWDNTLFAGAIADINTLEKAKSLHLDPLMYLNRNNSLEFFQKVGDGIETGRLPSNVADLMIVLRK